MHFIRIRFPFFVSSALVGVSTAFGGSYLAVLSSDTLGSLTATTSDPAELSGLLTRGSGLDAEALFAGYYDAAGWSESNALASPLSSEDYIEFSVSVASGYSFAPSSLKFFYEEGGNLQGPSRISLRSSLDNFSSELFLDTNTFDAAVHNLDLSSLADFAGTVNFRWYGYGAGAPEGLLGFTDNALIDAAGSPASIKLSGDLTPVPEPANVALSMGMIVVLLTTQRRQRRLK